MIKLKALTRLNLAALILSLVPAAAFSQTTHNVTVGDNFFNPSNLTIQAGDTVRWNNAAGGMPHDVTADNGSFQSQTSTSFVFERTFNNPGGILYHCTVHSAPGLNFMNGFINVEGAPPPAAFNINATLNDTWFNDATPGQGFFITVFEQRGEIFLAWFTYDTERPDPAVEANLGEPGHRWLTAGGPYEGDTAELVIELTEKGVFDSPEPVDQTQGYGTILLEFAGCDDAMVTYNIPAANVNGVIPLRRVSDNNIPACEELAAAR